MVCHQVHSLERKHSNRGGHRGFSAHKAPLAILPDPALHGLQQSGTELWGPPPRLGLPVSPCVPKETQNAQKSKDSQRNKTPYFNVTPAT